MSCAICEIRKEKRFCPAVHGRICPQCCGEQREVTLDCPSDCPYLQQAREHEKPRPADQFDRASLFLQSRDFPSSSLTKARASAHGSQLRPYQSGSGRSHPQ